MDDPLAWLADESDARRSRSLDRRIIGYRPGSGGRLEPLASGIPLLNFASNDYLGLAADPRLAEAARHAAERFGWGAGASPLVAGWREPHQRLATALASFEGVEAVALFPTGYAANVGVVSSLVGPGDAVFHDRLNHASLIDGTRLAGAALRVYPHRDADRLDQILGRERVRHPRVLVATDSIFSMDGDAAPLDQLAEVCRRHRAMFLVDEAHGTGVYGARGRGGCEHFAVESQVQARVGTLSKALGSLGGFAAGSRRLIDHLTNTARPLIYSTAIPPAAAAAATAALRIVQEEPDRRVKLWRLAARLRGRLSGSGLSVEPDGGPIVPIACGEASEALRLSDRLKQAGFLVPAIRPPTVPRGKARLRVSLSAAHSDADIDDLATILSEA